MHSRLCGCGCPSRLSSLRMRTGQEDVLLALAGSLCLFWLGATLLLHGRRVLASVSVATLLLAQNNPWLLRLLTHPYLAAGISRKASKPATSHIPTSSGGKSNTLNTFSWLKVCPRRHGSIQIYFLFLSPLLDSPSQRSRGLRATVALVWKLWS